ncbi:hypothetical protein ACFOLJ_14435 [Rugamonas sp. CCM 8940]|uniref:hypothetical protein n=1 Tax=Rugamonas sp. CCM 8940 TaxID=2765359 RepID=UPI0018F736CB|nr:hypothetical protein [Rugamonas sp. CCM 8940]MBJ7314313.1 hypothetical protein [Rugamonas sp. CCM 8940]
MTSFKASVQYQDNNGTAAADHADKNDLTDYLKAKKLMSDDEFVVASSLWVGENHGGKLGSVTVKAYLFDKPSYATVKDALDAIAGPIPVRAVKIEVTIEEFIGFFKRFEVVLTRKGFDIEGREYTTVE